VRSEPIRSCVGCRARDRQPALVRLTARDGAVVRDGAVAAPGRGAYLHARRACLATFARRGGFVRSLRCVVAKDAREALRAQFPEVVD
jgi:predicted RNA-binding protein YlxR (DUF448 family)